MGGFISGFLHGMFAPLIFAASLFMDAEMYSLPGEGWPFANNGWPYALGFLVGATSWVGVKEPINGRGSRRPLAS